ncbi:MAG TPA: AAA family ATPase, partial [Polyangiales bacterium]|nr:AAA family ATPase [Polyangiales bacterium]
MYVTAGGSVKLLDFGAVASFDEPQRPIGTPPCVAPETLSRQAIDARTDMFGLGALGYFALTGHHAYPARVLSQLPLLWQTPPIKPSDYALEIPQALDELILSLLSLEMDGRPRQIAEVVARLFAIAELPSDQATELARASLTNAGLIGRESELEQLRDLLRWSEGGRSATGVIRGGQGSGCTRLLDALSLEAKLRGHTVVRANASLCGGTDFALARELCRSVWAHEPNLARDTGHSLESALVVFDGRLDDDAHHVDAQRAFIAWCEGWTKQQPLLLIVDEADEIDLESAKLLAQLARRTEGTRLMIALSLRGERASARGPIASLTREATQLDLKPLDHAGIERLLRALFGDVPNLARVAHHCHRASEGLPGLAVNAARSLVERGLVKFASGSWQLPDHVDEPELSASERAAVGDGLLRLSAVASEFLRLLALVTEPAPFPAPRYVRALLRPDSAIVTAEGELFARHVLVTTNQGYAVGDKSLLSVVRERMRPSEAEFAHTQLAEFYASSSRGACAAYHFWRAGRPNQADVALAAALSPLGDPLGEDPSSFTSSSAAVALYEAMLTRRKKRNAPPSDLYPLRMILLKVATADHLELSRYAAETIDQLRIDAGIDLFEARANPLTSDADEALMRSCLIEAQARHEQRPEATRGLPPDLATRAIASCVTRLTSVYPAMFDVAASQRLAQLIRPLRSLSPLLEIADMIADQWSHALTRDDDVTGLRLRTLTASRNKPAIPAELREVVEL